MTQATGSAEGVPPSFVHPLLLPIHCDCGLPVHCAKVQQHSRARPLLRKCECASVPHMGSAVICLKDACTHAQMLGFGKAYNMTALGEVQ